MLYHRLHFVSIRKTDFYYKVCHSFFTTFTNCDII
nr:MAG TPA: hypothetical protein [Caudoviricetes sp.]